MIFKVQTPVAGDMSRVLVYNENQSVILSVPAEQVAGLLGGRQKIFVKGEVRGATLSIDREVAARSW